MLDGCVAIGRKLPGGDRLYESAIPLFWVEGGRLQMRWRSRDTYLRR